MQCKCARRPLRLNCRKRKLRPTPPHHHSHTLGVFSSRRRTPRVSRRQSAHPPPLVTSFFRSHLSVHPSLLPPGSSRGLGEHPASASLAGLQFVAHWLDRILILSPLCVHRVFSLCLVRFTSRNRSSCVDQFGRGRTSDRNVEPFWLVRSRPPRCRPFRVNLSPPSFSVAVRVCH